MANFIAICYTEAFLASRIATKAPYVDLKFRSLMEIYKKEDKAIAVEAIKSINNHWWYMTEELVIFALFDKEFHEDTKNEMVQRLLYFPPPSIYLPGKPKFPEHLLNTRGEIDLRGDLVSCIGPRSWLLFHLLEKTNEQLDWLHVPIIRWEQTVGFQKIQEIIMGFEVVNDCLGKGHKDDIRFP